MYGEDVLRELSIETANVREEYMLSQIMAIDVDDEENIYVLDRKEFYKKV